MNLEEIMAELIFNEMTSETKDKLVSEYIKKNIDLSSYKIRNVFIKRGEKMRKMNWLKIVMDIIKLRDENHKGGEIVSIMRDNEQKYIENKG